MKAWGNLLAHYQLTGVLGIPLSSALVSATTSVCNYLQVSLWWTPLSLQWHRMEMREAGTVVLWS